MRLRFWRGWGWNRRGAELDEELASHLRMAEQERAERGASPDEAAAAARRELGNATLVREAARDQWGWRWLEDFARDLRFSARALRKSPGFALAIVATLALGIGANVSMLNVVRMLLFRTPPRVSQPQEIVRLEAMDRSGQSGPDTANYQGYLRLAEHMQLLNIAAQGYPFATDFGRGAGAREVERNYVSRNYFDVLGTKLLMGRSFSAEEETRTHGDSVAILGYDFWQQQLAGDRKILGREVEIGGRPHTIIGIAPRGFNGMDPDRIDVWLPLGDSGAFNSTGSWWLQVIGRPVHNATRQQAASEATSVFLHGGGDSKETIHATPYSATEAGPRLKQDSGDQVALWLSGVAFLVFLIACANVANLFFVRAIQRRQEMAVRLQLGATRWRLLRQFLTESLVLSAIGGAAALLLAYWARPLVQAFLLPPHFYMGDFLKAGTLLLTGGFAVLAGIASGLWPAWRASRPELALALKSGGRALHERSTIRSVLLVGQVALTLLLSIGAALFVRSLRSVHGIQLGFDADHVLVAIASTSGYKPADVSAAYQQMLRRARFVPGVKQAALVAYPPFYSYGLSSYWNAASGSSPARDIEAAVNSVSPGYFAAIGMKILQGRDFLPSDRSGAPLVAIVDQSFAKEAAGNSNPVGRCVSIKSGGDCIEIVGVVPDERRYFLFDDIPGASPPNTVYRPLGQTASDDYLSSFAAGGLVMRTTGKPSTIERIAGEALAGVALGGRYVEVHPMMEKIDEQTLPWRMGASMFTLFGTLALALAAIGIYGLLAFLVRYRTAEIGLRLALGAMPGNILAMVVRRGMLLVGTGILIGTAAAIGLARLMKSLLYGVAPTDVASYAIAAAVVAAAGLLACWIPARRAMRVDPVSAMRCE
ncbi:MAG TPA: ABC transporter permease [Candidatus Acidoferrales bacterium]|nr:ABC transporter permease [Candidatus Acidoferrales bacterium]